MHHVLEFLEGFVIGSGIGLVIVYMTVMAGYLMEEMRHR